MKHFSIHLFPPNTRPLYPETKKDGPNPSEKDIKVLNTGSTFCLQKQIHLLNWERSKMWCSWILWKIKIEKRIVMIIYVQFSTHCSSENCSQNGRETSSTTSFTPHTDKELPMRSGEFSNSLLVAVESGRLCSNEECIRDQSVLSTALQHSIVIRIVATSPDQ